MRKIFIYMMVIFTVSLSASEIKWSKDYETGIKEATKLNKPVLFVSSRHTCKFCVILENTTFKNKEVIEALNKDFISIVSYSDEKDYIPRELWQPGTPAIWFLNPNGEPMFQPLMGAMNADVFLKAVAIVKKEFETLQGKKK